MKGQSSWNNYSSIFIYPTVDDGDDHSNLKFIVKYKTLRPDQNETSFMNLTECKLNYPKLLMNFVSGTNWESMCIETNKNDR